MFQTQTAAARRKFNVEVEHFKRLPPNQQRKFWIYVAVLLLAIPVSIVLLAALPAQLQNLTVGTAQARSPTINETEVFVQFVDTVGENMRNQGESDFGVFLTQYHYAKSEVGRAIHTLKRVVDETALSTDPAIIAARNSVLQSLTLMTQEEFEAAITQSERAILPQENAFDQVAFAPIFGSLLGQGKAVYSHFLNLRTVIEQSQDMAAQQAFANLKVSRGFGEHLFSVPAIHENQEIAMPAAQQPLQQPESANVSGLTEYTVGPRSSIPGGSLTLWGIFAIVLLAMAYVFFGQKATDPRMPIKNQPDVDTPVVSSDFDEFDLTASN